MAASSLKFPISIDEEQFKVTTPEGIECGMPIEALRTAAEVPPLGTLGLVYPDGTKAVLQKGDHAILVHETPPRVHCVKWIRDDSPAPFGRDARYEQVSIALPYIVCLIVFQYARGRYALCQRSECFFRNGVIRELDDELMYPALLNCSRFEPPDKKPLSWICTQHMDRMSIEKNKDANERFRCAIAAVLQTLLGDAFNRSSEVHEAGSWYGESVKRKVDSRIMSIKKWEAATRKDPHFALDVNWLPTGLSIKQVADRIFDYQGASRKSVQTAGDLARIIMNYRAEERGGGAGKP